MTTPDPKPAMVRDGVHITPPAATDADWRKALSERSEIDLVLEQARQLFRVSRSPRADALWPHLRPKLLVIEVGLNRMLRDQPDDPAVPVILQEVQRFLGRHP